MGNSPREPEGPCALGVHVQRVVITREIGER